MRLAFIGFGEAGRAYQAGLAEQDPRLAFAAYDLKLDADEKTRGAMEAAIRERGVALARAPQAAVDGADWVFSAVTADQSLEAARAAAPHLGAGQVFIDINSVSPDRKRESAALITARGAAYLDMAVMAPAHPKRHRAPVLIAGPDAEALAPALSALGFELEVAGVEIGAATAVKMVRSLFMKGLEAITVEALLAAAASGCLPSVMRSLERSFPGLGWPDFAAYQFERTLRHGARRAAEMRESAATISALGLHGALADAVAAVEAAMGAQPDASIDAASLETEITRIAEMRRDPASRR